MHYILWDVAPLWRIRYSCGRLITGHTGTYPYWRNGTLLTPNNAVCQYSFLLLRHTFALSTRTSQLVEPIDSKTSCNNLAALFSWRESYILTPTQRVLVSLNKSQNATRSGCVKFVFLKIERVTDRSEFVEPRMWRNYQSGGRRATRKEHTTRIDQYAARLFSDATCLIYCGTYCAELDVKPSIVFAHMNCDKLNSALSGCQCKRVLISMRFFCVIAIWILDDDVDAMFIIYLYLLIWFLCSLTCYLATIGYIWLTVWILIMIYSFFCIWELHFRATTVQTTLGVLSKCVFLFITHI